MIRIGVETPDDWAEPTRECLRNTRVTVTRIDSSRISTVEAQARAFSVIREFPIRSIIVLFEPEAWTNAAIIEFCRRNNMGSGDAIEMGNEWSYSYKTATAELLIARARSEATRLIELKALMLTEGVTCKLLGQADEAIRGATWVNEMFATQPTLRETVDGWTVHPYGKSEPTPGRDGYRSRIENMLTQLRARGVTNPRIWMTEYGISSDNGNNLENNYGWPTALTYREQATDVIGVLTDFRENYRNVEVVIIFQAVDQRNHGASAEREGYFGTLIRESFAPKPLALALASFEEEVTRLVTIPILIPEVPAVGTEWRFTLPPSTQNWRLMFGSARIVLGATEANRICGLRIEDGRHVLWQGVGSTSFRRESTKRVSYSSSGSPGGEQISGNPATLEIPGAILEAGWIISSFTEGLQAVDQYSEIALYFVQTGTTH